MSDENRIHLGGEFVYEEALASGVVQPGMLVELTSATASTVRAHATEGGTAERMFALEDALQGNTISDNYASGDLVALCLPLPGSSVFAIIKAGENISKGEKLVSAGDGTLIAENTVASGTTVAQVIAVAKEALDLSASGAVNTRLAVRVL
jgi:hypothetical protein